VLISSELQCLFPSRRRGRNFCKKVEEKKKDGCQKEQMYENVVCACNADTTKTMKDCDTCAHMGQL